MNKKYYLLITLIIIPLILISCFNTIKNNDYDILDTIIIDENTKNTTVDTAKIEFKLEAETESITYKGNSDDYGISSDYNLNYTGNIIYCDYNFIWENENDPSSQFKKLYLNNIEIGSISTVVDEISGLNKVNWTNIKVDGKLLYATKGDSSPRVLKDDKVFKITSSGDLKELKAYENILKKLGNKINTFESSLNGRIDLYFIENNDTKYISIVDTEEDLYYEIDSSIAKNFLTNNIEVLGIDNNKIFIKSISDYPENLGSIGYVENNEFTTILSPDDGLNINVSNVIYYNDRLLFSGYVEEKNAVWNYDIINKNLTCEIELESNTICELYPNKQMNKIILSNYSHDKQNTINLGVLNFNLEISNITNILSSANGMTIFAGWADSGDLFAVNSLSSTSMWTSSYKVFKIID